jgi:phosphatidylserine decarboxylase
MTVQIAGFLARRIVCSKAAGERLSRGERFGMIKLGSKVDLYLPEGVVPAVVVGQRVKAGETVIGVISSDDKKTR